MREQIVIEAGRGSRQYWRDVWQYRELFLLLAWRDLLVRYKQTVLGFAWALARPLAMAITLTLVFHRLAKLQPPDGVPYIVLALCGQLPWAFFAAMLTESGGSLVNNQGLIAKVYFPRILIPAGSIAVSSADFLISSMLLTGFMIWFGVMPDWHLITLPFFLAIIVALALGTGLLVSALNVRYRDFKHLVPVLVQLGFYLSPVAYASSNVPERYRMIYALNPMVGVIDGFRWAVLSGREPLYLPALAISVCSAILMMGIGVRYFRSVERGFADII